MQRRQPRGFTLIELLIVISIIAILATISVPVTKNVMNKARSASAQNDCMQIQNAINSLAAQPIGPDGYRGAILLQAGTYDINTQLLINASGIVNMITRGWMNDSNCDAITM